MIFVWLGRLVAVALIAFGALRIGVALFVAKNFPDPDAYTAATRRYIGSGTTGEAIDQGIVYLLVGVAFGVMAQVGAKRKTGTNL